jgi:UDP-N-acetylmuramate dehydrogenase
VIDLARVEAAAPAVCHRDHPLAPYLAYKVGGPADLYAEPSTREDLAALLRAAHGTGTPLFVLGGGTNLVIRDGGIRGLVVRLGKGFRTARVEGTRLVAGAAATMMRAAAAAEKAGLTGFEFGYDIPGMVGGAMRMNAGAHGSEVQNVLEAVHGVTLAGEPITLLPADIAFAYRRATYPVDMVVTEVVFGLREGDRAEVEARRREYHEFRLRTQPKGKSVGSVFMNPPGDHAGRLIEAAGLKGTRRGGAVISEKHANWILNEGGASAADIEELIELARDTVRERFGVELETEVKIVGEPASEEGNRVEGGGRGAPTSA